jgi:hypothetical protein
MDEDWDRDPDHIVNLDVTGDPQLDQFGYQSPRNMPRTWAHPPSHQIVPWPPEMGYQPGMGPLRPGPLTSPAPDEQQSQGPLPGQRGAYFEVRTRRVWCAPWRKIVAAEQRHSSA